ncbi:hypothetical protein PVAND_015224 [Polypedilum vanderplanki]|uniref:Uncharacterized protein n=1 Tax=Polypedilum vanderplanki TaxID=319348 RepID=A0A9J6BC05_POLVA|nr:hypothetical protein PVAND_015224 [Polypedilum vanderplanki]
MKVIKKLLKISVLVAMFFAFATAESANNYKFECGNKFYRYNLDDEPAKYGLSAGQYAPGKKAYLGVSLWFGIVYDVGRIQLNPPGLLMPTVKTPGIFVTDNSKIWYLYNNPNHKYEWVSTSFGKKVPFAIEIGLKTSGLYTNFGRIVRNNTVLLGNAVSDMGVVYYVDENGNSQVSPYYEVLTCKSSKYEAPIQLPPIPSTPVDSTSGCVHKWQPYNYDDAPARNGIAAGQYDCGNIAYVGKGAASPWTKPGRLQIVDKKGIFIDHRKSNFFINDSTVHYLVDNPNYTYYWVNYDRSGMPPQNAVSVKSSELVNFPIAVIRAKIDGHMDVGMFITPLGYFRTNDENGDEMRYDFEILVCDPWPKYKCAQQWKKLNANISVDGFSVDSTSFIGRGTRKCINGCDHGLGKIQSGSNGVNYLDEIDLTATAVFDNSSNVEYLVKNPSDTYKWQPSRNGVKVVNALELHKRVGKVRPGDGLFFIDPVTGKQQSTSSYEVLTCTSPDASNGEYEEESDADWFGSFWMSS